METELISAPEAPPPAIAGPTREGLYDAVMAGRSAKTARAYRQDLEDFARFLGKPGPAEALAELVSWSQGAANHAAHQFRAYLAARRLAPATIARRIAALRSSVKLARAFGVVGWTLEVEAPKVKAYRDTRGPGREGWRAMLELARARTDSPMGRRNLAILLLMHDLGLRRGEVVALDLADVDPAASRLWIVGKGRAEKESVALTARCALALLAWIADLPDDGGPLFRGATRARTPTARRLSGDALEDVVGKLGCQAGQRRKVRPHGLRHQAITEALDKTGGDVRRVMKFSRHAKPETLLLYDDARRDDAGDVSRMLAEE